MTSQPFVISSRENPLFKQIKRLAHDNLAYRKLGQVWLEGDHLCRAAAARGVRPAVAVICDGHASKVFFDTALDGIQKSAIKTVVFSQPLFAELSALESPAQEGWLVELSSNRVVDPTAPTVVLDRVQDAGNVGSILRSASAFGFTQVVALKGTAALWSPKVVRAGMGAHFNLNLIESATLDEVRQLSVPLVVTSSHQGEFLHRTVPLMPSALVVGHEGQGVCADLLDLASTCIRIAQPGGEESLNVAAAAAVCLHAMGTVGLPCDDEKVLVRIMP